MMPQPEMAFLIPSDVELNTRQRFVAVYPIHKLFRPASVPLALRQQLRSYENTNEIVGEAVTPQIEPEIDAVVMSHDGTASVQTV